MKMEIIYSHCPDIVRLFINYSLVGDNGVNFFFSSQKKFKISSYIESYFEDLKSLKFQSSKPISADMFY